MKEINNEVLSEFCERLIKVMDREDGMCVPFWMSVLYEKFSEDISDLNEFIEDLKHWNDYLIIIESTILDPYCAYTIAIDLREIFEYDDDYDDHPDYNYEIRFSYDERYTGYCQCTPQDKGFRRDEGCCGEICDWDAPKFSLHKITNVTSHEYCGMQKDYWDFEDEFYKSRKELSNKKASEERELEIEELTSQLNDIAERIEKLMEQE